MSKIAANNSLLPLIILSLVNNSFANYPGADLIVSHGDTIYYDAPLYSHIASQCGDSESVCKMDIREMIAGLPTFIIHSDVACKAEGKTCPTAKDCMKNNVLSETFPVFGENLIEEERDALITDLNQGLKDFMAEFVKAADSDKLSVFSKPEIRVKVLSQDKQKNLNSLAEDTLKEAKFKMAMLGPDEQRNPESVKNVLKSIDFGNDYKNSLRDKYLDQATSATIKEMREMKPSYAIGMTVFVVVVGAICASPKADDGGATFNPDLDLSNLVNPSTGELNPNTLNRLRGANQCRS